MRRFWYWLVSLFSGKVRSRSGHVGRMRSKRRFPRWVRPALIAAALIALIVVAFVVRPWRMIDGCCGFGSEEERPVTSAVSDLTVVDYCNVTINERRFVAVDCLTYVEKAATVVKEHPIASALTALAIYALGVVTGWIAHGIYGKKEA